jgi:hypothetical protein
MRALYLIILRGHFHRLVRRGRDSVGAISDSSYLTAFGFWANLATVCLAVGVKLPTNRVALTALALSTMGVVYFVIMSLTKSCRTEIERAPAEDGAVLENVLSWIHLLGSVVLVFVAATFTTSFD